MAILMTGLCEKGVELIWKQCNEELYPQGIEYLEEAAHAGDAEGWFFLGNCYSWGDGAVGFSDKKAYECYKKGIEGGSVRCVLGAARAGQFDEELKKASPCTLEESYRAVLQSAEEGDAFSAFQIAAAYEWETIFDLLQPEEQKRENCYKWYEQAAKGGIVSAMVKVGKCCLNGQYVPKNEEMALKWADRCAALGNAWGLYRMGLHHLNLGNMEAAWEYFEAAAKQGALKAFLHLGRMYLNGQGTDVISERLSKLWNRRLRRRNRRALQSWEIFSTGMKWWNVTMRRLFTGTVVLMRQDRSRRPCPLPICI